MSDHLTPIQLENYQRRTLPPAELPEAVSHLATCESCRAALRSQMNTSAALASVKGELADVAHLQFEEMESYLAGEAPSEIRATVEAHAGVCERCARELRDLRAFVNLPAKAPPQEELVPQQKRFGWMQSYAFRRIIYGLLSFVVFALVIANVIYHQMPTPAPHPADQRKNARAASQALTSTAPLEWKDGPRRFTINPTGQIRGLEDFPPEYVSRIQNAIGVAHFKRPNTAESSWASRELITARKRFPDSHLLLGVPVPYTEDETGAHMFRSFADWLAIRPRPGGAALLPCASVDDL